MSAPYKPLQTAELVWCDKIPYSTQYSDFYFSAENPLSEKMHVYINANHLIERWQKLPEDSRFIIAETGFGSGLNFLLCMKLWKQYAPKSARLYYFSCENHPLKRRDIQKCIQLWPSLYGFGLKLLNNYPTLTPGYHNLQFKDLNVSLILMLGDAAECFHQLLTCGDQKNEMKFGTAIIDAWFLDGFSPVKNPKMWSDELFATMAMLSNKQCTISSYASDENVKRRLTSHGFKVLENTGRVEKKDMISGFFSKCEASQSPRFTPWHTGHNKIVATKKALVLGAGLAGCNVANALAKRGWKVILLEGNQSVGHGASFNHQAIIYPKFSVFHSPMNDFMLGAYQFALRMYAEILQKQPIGELSGILQLANSKKEKHTQEKLVHWFLTYPELGSLVNEEELSRLAGIEIQSPGLFIPGSGWMDSPKLCQYLIAHKNIQFVPNTKVAEIEHENNFWQFGKHSAEVLVVACGHQSNRFLQTQHLPLINVYGQVTQIKSSAASNNLKIPLCGDGHILPSRNGMHSVGATYHVDRDDLNCTLADQNANIERLATFVSNLYWSNEIIGNWGAVRAATSDYLPLVGPVINPDAFNACYQKLSLDKNKWIEPTANYLPGFYVCTGFGSRGLTSIPLCAEWLASCINNELSILPRSLVKALSPSRFLHRQIARRQH